jgi:GMP synthase-like glutamine amidotransferase
MRLCIIENGLIPEELQDAFGSYPAMIESWLAPALPEADFTYVSAVRGEPLPEATAFDGYLLTGSRHSCYEHSPWMLHLVAHLLRAPDHGRRLRRPHHPRRGRLGRRRPGLPL